MHTFYIFDSYFKYSLFIYPFLIKHIQYLGCKLKQNRDSYFVELIGNGNTGFATRHGTG